MSLEATLAAISRTEPFVQTAEYLQKGTPELYVHGIEGSLGAILLSHLRRTSDRQILAITPDTESAEKLRDDIEAVAGGDSVCYFPDWELVPFEEKSPHVEVAGLRLEVMQRLLIGVPSVIVTPVTALLRPTLEPEAIAAASRVLRVGDLVDLDELAKWLRMLSYEPENQVDQIGQYSRRGGIIDVYTYGSDRPVRIELFDDEIESIRQFDAATQRSVDTVSEIEILPRREFLSGGDWWGDAEERLIQAEKQYDSPLTAIREKVNFGVHFDGIEFWGPVLTGVKPTLLDHLDARSAVYVVNPEGITEHSDRFMADARDLIERRRERDLPVLPYEAAFHTWDDIQAQFGTRPTVRQVVLALGEECIEFGARSSRRYEGSMEAVRSDVDAMSHRGGTTLVLAENDAQARRLDELLETSADQCDIRVGRLHDGFVYPQGHIQILTDNELFNRTRRRHRYRRFQGTTPIKDAFSLTPGDIIIHEEHGIGIYQGMQRISVDGVARDTLRILYRDGDKLFVPAEEVNRIQRYSKEDEDAPVLSKLGGADWDRLKAKTKKGVVKLAKELIQLYAIRQNNPGFAYTSDGHWMSEMEAAFVFEETRDQLRVIQEIKADMEKTEPMDRLVCGDVGFGKTEVAMRAAFKAVCDNKQVAVLVPTTILAQQHYATFVERMVGFPVNVDVLSRFRTKKQSEQVLEDVARGKVDILIGTHRLISKDVKFRDLGLLVIDEEQRFGVKHKERLKHMRQTVDVLSMTATPIPRTLYLSIMGARDMSVITTPPRDRLPVHTEVIPFDADRIAESILREIDRGGQVFFLHNRVVTIEEQAEWLKELLPDVRFRVAHGQLPERKLERVMVDFMEHKFDVLVTSMIIQSGLDMPNVNTILVDRADTFGLAELYQLRGRVGRSSHRAFAYLMIPPDRQLNSKSRRRLRAIEEHSDLGAGFRVAMRDLEIRGAGNLLGNEQHGFITAVGFEMYVKLLDDAVKEMQGEVVDTLPDCEVDMRLSAFLPDDYVPDGERKMELYRRASTAVTLAGADEFSDELRDRYGPLPEPAEALVLLTRIRILGRRLRAQRVSIDSDGRTKLHYQSEYAPNQAQITKMVGRSLHALDFQWDGEMVIALDVETPAGNEQAQKVIEGLVSLVDTADGNGKPEPEVVIVAEDGTETPVTMSDASAFGAS